MTTEPLHTAIEKTIQTKVGLVVLENYSGFPYSESNLYCRAEDGEIVWQAEKPDSNSLYIRVMLNVEGYTLSTHTNTGQACDIDLKTGKLVSQVGIK